MDIQINFISVQTLTHNIRM